MTKYRKRPVEVEAIKFIGTNLAECREFLGSHYQGYEAALRTPVNITIRTLEGDMNAPVGHWLIRGVRGEHYSCDPDVFAATYEPAEAPSGRVAFDWSDPTTWPPEGECVRVHDAYGERGRRSLILYTGSAPLWKDEGNDLDDGIYPGDELSWERLP